MTCIMCDSEEVQNQEEGKCSSWERTSTEQVVVGVFGAVHVAAFTRSAVKYLARFLDQEKKNMNITSLIVQRQRSVSCIYSWSPKSCCRYLAAWTLAFTTVARSSIGANGIGGVVPVRGDQHTNIR